MVAAAIASVTHQNETETTTEKLLTPIAMSHKGKQMAPKVLLLKTNLSPGDVCTLTVAVESLHRNYPGEYKTYVECSLPQAFEANPNVHIGEPEEEEYETIEMEYPTIHLSDDISHSFIYGYLDFLANKLRKRITPFFNAPYIPLSDEEKEWMGTIEERVGKKVPYWLVNSGVKRDFTCKQWPLEYYQEVVDKTRGSVQWIQIGAMEHNHRPLKHVINLVGQTDHRELMRLVYHSEGGLGPVTYLQHLCAAYKKPYFCIAGGREASTWIQYPFQHTFHSVGTLPCCKEGGCWKSRVVPLLAYDKDTDDSNSRICERPLFSFESPIPECMGKIVPEAVIASLVPKLVSRGFE